MTENGVFFLQGRTKNGYTAVLFMPAS